MMTSFKVSPDIRYRVIDDEAVVVRQSEGDVLVLNQVAARVLQLVGEGLSPTEISDRVVAEYDGIEAQIREDVESFFGELEELNVIERSPPTEDAL
jgi:hypothetical protein